MIDLDKAHKHCFGNRQMLLAGQRCGCFSCLAIFDVGDITEWVDLPEPGDSNEDGITALCPKCGIDAVLGEHSGFPITEAFLDRMRRRFFTVKD